MQIRLRQSWLYFILFFIYLFIYLFFFFGGGGQNFGHYPTLQLLLHHIAIMGGRESLESYRHWLKLWIDGFKNHQLEKKERKTGEKKTF